MKTIVKLTAIALLGFLFYSCDDGSSLVGNNNYTTAEYNLNPFENVRNPFPGSVRLKKGDHKIVVNAESNIIDLLTFEVKNNSLQVGSKDKDFESHGINLTIYAQNFNELINNGSANWTSDSLNINPTIISNGSGKFNLTGTSTTQKIQSNGSGKIDLSNMPTKDVEIVSDASGSIFVKAENNANVLINGSGDVTIENISGEIKVTINGSGDLYYSGNPNNIIQTINGSGKVIEMP
jgi:DUF4097 and DUF4098 domain-containing protein YvlB